MNLQIARLGAELKIPANTTFGCFYIVTDRTGRFLLGVSYPGHKVTVNPIGPPGTVQAPQQVLPNHPNAHAIVVDAANRHVLVATLGNDRINQFTFDAPPACSHRARHGPRR